MKMLRMNLAALVVAFHGMLSVVYSGTSGTLAPCFQGGTPAFTITSGPTQSMKQFGDGQFPAVSIAGKIDPALPSGIIGNITSIELQDCAPSPPGGVGVDPADFMGGANGASFTMDVKRSALPASCKSAKITYTTQGSVTYEVTFANPIYRKTAVIDFGAFTVVSGGVLYTLDVNVLEQNGSLDTGFTGSVHVTSSSLMGSRMKLNESYGTAIVVVVDGIGTLKLQCVNAVSGDTIILDLTSTDGRLNASRSSADVQ
jgi:hypothetical protein